MARQLRRHLVYVRKDQFLLLADTVLGTRPGRLYYRGWWPLPPGIAFCSTSENSAGFLWRKRQLGPRANRSLLGHSLLAELLLARFHSDGKVEPLMKIR